VSLRPRDQRQVSKVFRYEIKDPKLIFDATAHIGADAINFAKTWPTSKIIAAEIDPFTYGALKKNIEHPLVGVTGRIEPVNVDAIKYLETTDNYFDIIFFDPPWGSRYNDADHGLDLFLSGKNLIDIVVDVINRGIASNIVLKLPYNYNYHALNKKVSSRRHIILKPRGEESFSLLIVKCVRVLSL
jgi:tRNA G37 N-methylase Trm5